ncbi:uncharacterized protein [Macrobrachium rosenbergii]|uniref:uncharacterized protein isoform X1 n=2 Tax=Macrobrachium rosenbergii TaxID=79674 RepID=UPI0034D506D8
MQKLRPEMICPRKIETPHLIFERCCCFKLRTAVLIVASLEILAAFGLLIMHMMFTTAHITHIMGRNEAKDSRDSMKDPQEKASSPMEKRPRVDIPILVGPILGVCTHILIYMAVSSILIHGVRKNRTSLMRIWLWVRAVNLLDILVESIYYLPLYIMETVGYITLLAVSIASILIVRSYVVRFSQNEEFVQLEEVPEDA